MKINGHLHFITILKENFHSNSKLEKNRFNLSKNVSTTVLSNIFHNKQAKI